MAVRRPVRDASGRLRGPCHPSTPAPRPRARPTSSSWLAGLGLEPVERAERDGIASWDLVLDGRRRFDLRVTVILDPSLAVIVWAHYAPPIGDMFRKSYRKLLRWNDEFPFAKFSVSEDERPVLAVELPIARGDRGCARRGARADPRDGGPAARRDRRLAVARRPHPGPGRPDEPQRGIPRPVRGRAPRAAGRGRGRTRRARSRPAERGPTPPIPTPPTSTPRPSPPPPPTGPTRDPPARLRRARDRRRRRAARRRRPRPARSAPPRRT